MLPLFEIILMEKGSTIVYAGIGAILEKAWNATKANLLLMVGVSVVFCTMYHFFYYIPLAGGIARLLCGFFITMSLFSAYDAFEKTGKLEFNDFFSWTPKVVRLLSGNLLVMALIFLFVIPLALFMLFFIGGSLFSALWTNPQDIIALFGTGMLIYGIIVLLVLITLGVMLFAYPFIIQFTDLPLMDCLKLSMKIGRNNIGQIILYTILAFGLIILGIIAFLIGLAIVLPLLVGIQYYFMRNLFPLEEIKQEWDFMNESNARL